MENLVQGDLKTFPFGAAWGEFNSSPKPAFARAGSQTIYSRFKIKSNITDLFFILSQSLITVLNVLLNTVFYMAFFILYYFMLVDSFALFANIIQDCLQDMLNVCWSIIYSEQSTP